MLAVAAVWNLMHLDDAPAPGPQLLGLTTEKKVLVNEGKNTYYSVLDSDGIRAISA